MNLADDYKLWVVQVENNAAWQASSWKALIFSKIDFHPIPIYYLMQIMIIGNTCATGGAT